MSNNEQIPQDPTEKVMFNIYDQRTGQKVTHTPIQESEVPSKVQQLTESAEGENCFVARRVLMG